MSNEKTAIDDFKEAIADKERPLDKQAPGASFAVVGLTYLVVLSVAALVLAFFLWMFV